MIVRTRQKFRCAASTVWPLLLDSQMDLSSPLMFRLGVPRPLSCRLPRGKGGIGGERECVSDQGIVHQRILEWEPPVRLTFRMEQSDLPQLHSVPELVDTFDLFPGADPQRTVVTRTTQVRIRGPHASWSTFLLFLGLKQVHRYVFRNWRRLAAQGSRGRGRLIKDGPATLVS